MVGVGGISHQSSRRWDGTSHSRCGAPARAGVELVGVERYGGVPEKWGRGRHGSVTRETWWGQQEWRN